jgi:hypothetical protein
MKNLFTRFIAALSAGWSRFFYAVFNSRPGLKRGALVLVLYAGFSVPVMFVFGWLAPIWALMLLALFWGMGAERASLEWDPVFALPPLSAFAFWRWHALEKKRFIAVLLALGGGVAATLLIEVLA